ncbi:MAG: betaine-aldehyde dehydrogenase [Nocardioides sp.]|nr:betaine-aldehyde dehydrogenase [Nocardioides sp.]
MTADTATPTETGNQSGRWDALPLLVDGAEVTGRGAVLEVIDPATEEVVTEVRAADAAQVDEAVAAARRAFVSPAWAEIGGEGRRELIHRLADLVEQHVDELADAVTTEAGTPVSISAPLQVMWPVQHLRWYADQAVVDREEDLGPHQVPVPSHSVVGYRPVGVVAAIAAYNYPITLAVHKLGPALLTGCTVVLMPSPRTPVATLLLARLIREAGFPPGVVNVVVGGVEEARRLTEHPDVAKVAFTGSVEVGRHVMCQAASHLAGVVLELGGKSPAIMLPDADVAAVAPAVHLRYCRNGGQACAAPTRLLVPRAQWDTFVDVTRSTIDEVVVGDPRDPATVVGPMITAAHRDRVERYVADAVASGASVVAGGGRPDLARGWFTNPAVVADVDNSWPIAQEEIFGPVSVAMPYDSVDEAVAIANDSMFGLHAYVFSADLEAARALAPRLRVGAVTINGGGGFRADAPMGGFGVSGIGREIGHWGIHEFLEPQHVQWATPAG